MEEILEILQSHVERYPIMRPQDCIKLVYQKNYGPGHMIDNEAMSLCRIFEEMEESEETELLTEPIGNHLCRLYLGKAKHVFKAEDINDIFVRTANIHNASMAAFMKDMKTVQKNITLLPASFSQEEYDAFAAWHRSEGYPPVHHSKEYVEAYHPHYRVVYQGFVESLEIQP